MVAGSNGRLERFPEVDRAAWFELASARVKINDAQCITVAPSHSAESLAMYRGSFASKSGK